MPSLPEASTDLYYQMKNTFDDGNIHNQRFPYLLRFMKPKIQYCRKKTTHTQQQQQRDKKRSSSSSSSSSMSSSYHKIVKTSSSFENAENEEYPHTTTHTHTHTHYIVVHMHLILRESAFFFSRIHQRRFRLNISYSRTKKSFVKNRSEFERKNTVN